MLTLMTLRNSVSFQNDSSEIQRGVKVTSPELMWTLPKKWQRFEVYTVFNKLILSDVRYMFNVRQVSDQYMFYCANEFHTYNFEILTSTCHSKCSNSSQYLLCFVGKREYG